MARMKSERIVIALSSLATFPLFGPAYAGWPMIVDDARFVDGKACQLETGVTRNSGSTDLWFQPACNPTGNLEIAIGGGRAREDGGKSELTEELVQLKTLFRPYVAGGWGIGLGVGTVRHPRRETASGWPGDAYFYVPLSFAVGSDDWVMHVNAGAKRMRDVNRTIAIGGLGNEVRLRDDLQLLAEVYALDRGRPFYQAGFRYSIVKDRIQMDATYGNRAVSDGSERWYSVGFRLLSPAFLP
jgi:hypothetical protein